MGDLSHFLKDAWEVLVLFVIPVGGGIPGGVLLARAKGIAWPVTSLLYLVSDVGLACVFEPLMLLVIRMGRRSAWVQRLREAMKRSTEKSIARYGARPGILSLIMISFGVDPMTGRSAAKAAGHGFVVGWAIAIAGDMLFFWLLLVSTLFLSGILGDGTWATLAILVITMGMAHLVRRVSSKREFDRQVDQ
jgi:hypothetical protein